MSKKAAYKVLLICTGNTCRSAMAEGIAKKIVSDKKIKNLQFSSGGTGMLDNVPATEYAIQASAHWGIDISAHRSRPISKSLIEESDLILAMSPEHMQVILSLDKKAAPKAYLLKGFPQPFSPTQERIDDPIGGTLEQYNQTFLELDEVMRRIFPKLVEYFQSHD